MKDSNVIDFYEADKELLAVGAESAKVYLDGQLCDEIIVENITLAADNNFNQAILSHLPLDSRFRGNDNGCGNDRLPEEIDSLIRCGQRIVIKVGYDGGIGSIQPQQIPLFAGFVEQIDTDISSKRQKITIVAKDFSARLKRKTVYGRGVYSDGGQAVFIAGADTVFNPAGAANRAKQAINQNGRNFKGFAADENKAEFFTCADAIYYLLCSYISAGELVIPTLEQLEKLTCERGIIDVDVTGLNLIDALRRCCGQVGLRFKFIPNPQENAPAEAIVFFRPQLCRNIELNCQWPGERINAVKTNLAEITAKKNYAPITHRYIVQGDYKIYEATFELVKGWDPALEEHDYDKYSPLMNENFNEVRDVWRKWCLNEAGDYSGSPYNQGPAFDFSKIFENDNYIQRRRRFLPALTGTQDGDSIGYHLEVSYVNGNYWWTYMDSFKVLLDECGVWLSVEQLDTNMWFAILKGILKFRITASVMADERLSFAVADGAVNSTAEVVDKVITLPRRFKYQKVSPYSIFDGTSAKQLDDTQALAGFANNLASAGGFETEQTQLKTLCLSPVFTVGDGIITSPDSRDIIGVKYDNRSISRIEKVQMDFVNQRTILTTVKKRR